MPPAEVTEQKELVEATVEVRPDAPAEAPIAPEPEPAAAEPSRRSRIGTTDLVGIGGLVILLSFLWGRAAGTWFWLDEGIAAGISSHSLGSIPELLRQDGSPPLYYVLLHLWMSLVGDTEVQTHLLSLIFALAVVPVSLWAGWSLFGRRTGWMCALVVALNPFVAFYATETRMYSLVLLLTLVALATFLHAFVFGRRRHVPAFAVSLALLLYTHNWGLLFAAGAALALVPCVALSTERRRVVTDAVLGFGAAALLYAPWVPTLLYQRSQELQPWAQQPTLLAVRDDVARVIGGPLGVAGAVPLALGAGIGLAVVLRRPRSRTALAVIAMAIVVFVILAAGWASSVWAYRYLAVVVPPVVLVAAIGLARGGRPALAALGVAAFVTAPIAVKTPPYLKSNARAVAEVASTRLGPGDLVLSPDLQMVPLLANYLPPGLRYATTAGPVRDEYIVDWRGSLERLRRGDPAVTLPALLDAVPPGGHVLVACPPVSVTGEPTGLAQSPAGLETTGASTVERTETSIEALRTVPPPEGVSVFHALILVRCQQTTLLVRNDPRLRLDLTLKAPTGVAQTPVDGYVFTKRG